MDVMLLGGIVVVPVAAIRGGRPMLDPADVAAAAGIEVAKRKLFGLGGGLVPLDEAQRAMLAGPWAHEVLRRQAVRDRFTSAGKTVPPGLGSWDVLP